MRPPIHEDHQFNKVNYRVNLLNWFSIQVLMVTDDEVSYGDASGVPISIHQFGLKEVVRALTSRPFRLPWIRVVKAHRRQDPMGTGSGTTRVTPADIENFVFTANALNGFDQVWLFGAENADPTLDLAPAELQALTHFMNAGGGVFATGDHADLGVTLNGMIPRVRSMRKWFYPNPGPNGEPVAPDPLSANRLDTTQPNPPGQFPFDNQSDAIPMPIVPTWYGFGWAWKYPHPLLCGNQGVINVMPDHMHEGEVITPTGADPNANWTGSGVPGGLGTTLNINGEQIVEYPAQIPPFGSREAPVIVAQADVIGGHTTPSTESHTGSAVPTTSRRFACIGAYDGHRSGVGRVAVDSTWHHFFNLNLVGDPTAPSPKNQGFDATPAGQAALAQIENYYVNIATWLTPYKWPFLLGWLLSVLRAATTAELLPMAHRMGDPFLLQVGDAIHADLRRFLPPCTVLDFVLPIYWEMVRELGLPPPPDPWATPPRETAINPTEWAVAALGGMAVALDAALYHGKGFRRSEAKGLLQQGMIKGLQVYAQTQARQAKAVLSQSEEMLKGFAEHEK